MRHGFLATLTLAAALTSGCATVEALDKASRGGPLIFGGTQLDAAALEGNPYTLARYRREYGLTPPPHPALDLPFSVVLDTLLLPATVTVGLYRAVWRY